MSVYAMAWAWQQRCRNASEKLVLLALADFSDDEGVCWPGTRKLSEKCGVTQRQVRAHMQLLEESAFVERVERTHESGRRLSNLYRLPIPTRKKTSGSPSVADSQGDPAVDNRGDPVTDNRGDPVMDNRVLVEPSDIEPSEGTTNPEPVGARVEPSPVLTVDVEVWKALVRDEAKTQTNVGTMVQMVLSLTGVRRDGGQIAAVYKAFKDPERAIQAVYDACTNPAVTGNPVRYALGAASSKGSSSRWDRSATGSISATEYIRRQAARR